VQIQLEDKEVANALVAAAFTEEEGEEEAFAVAAASSSRQLFRDNNGRFAPSPLGPVKPPVVLPPRSSVDMDIFGYVDRSIG